MLKIDNCCIIILQIINIRIVTCATFQIQHFANKNHSFLLITLKINCKKKNQI